MKIKLFITILAFAIVCMSNIAKSQVYNECIGDTVYFSFYRVIEGTVQWQDSTGGVWTDIPGATSLTYHFIASTNRFLRAEVVEKFCNPKYLTVKTIIVNSSIVANAGADQSDIVGTSTTLAGNNPTTGTGTWRILSGNGGSFGDSTVYNTEFTGTIGTAYQLTWTISNACGTSIDTVNISFVDPVSNVTNPTTGKVWMDRNLGASQVATSSTDVAAYGDLYQWGRAADGHQIRTSATTTTLSNSDTPEHGNFIVTSSSPYDWRSPQNDNLWQGVNGVNNPCPSGYRLPTFAEWEDERLSWSSSNAAGAYASSLKLTMAGYRGSDKGFRYVVGTWGFYASSTVSDIYVWMLTFQNEVASMSHGYRAYGLSMRCIKD